MATAYKDLCIDAADAHRLGRFWGRALGLEFGVEPDDGPMADLSGPTPQHRVWMNPVPEPKSVKQRVHLDVHAASIEEHLAWGATVLDAESFHWTVMADPEGGEYCLFVRDEPPSYRLYESAVRSGSTPTHSLPGSTSGGRHEPSRGSTGQDVAPDPERDR